MKIIYENRSKKRARVEEVIRLEEKIKLPIPLNIKNYIIEHSGDVLLINNKRCGFKISYTDGRVQTSFIENVLSVEEIYAKIENQDVLEFYVKNFSLSENYVEANFLFPLFDVPNGSIYVAIGGKHFGKIYLADNGDFGITFLSMSLDIFLENLFEN